MDPELQHTLELLNYCAIFVAAISGAAAGIKSRADVFGVAVLAFATACSGGIVRDLLIGDAPPENIRSWQPVVITLAASLVTILFLRYLQWFLSNPVLVFDAFGLGLFTVLGANKALDFAITPIWAILLGVVTGVGGGVARDMLLARVPVVLQREIYATCSLAGAVVVVGASYVHWLRADYAAGLGAGLCIALRLAALHYNWNMPAVKLRRRS